MSEYRIEFSVQRLQPYAGTEDFVEIGFGSSGTWDGVDSAVHIVVSMVQNREWETTPEMPDPSETP